MSNRAFLEIIECRKIHYENKWVEARLSDDFDSGKLIIPTEDSGVDLKDDLSVLKYCIDYGNGQPCDDSDGDFISAVGVLNSLLESERGITINDNTFYSWDEIKHLF